MGVVVPYKILCTSSADILATGTCIGIRSALAKAASTRSYHRDRPDLLQGFMAPSSKLNFLFGITNSESTSCLVPRPVHSGQAPCGELNEKSRGSIAGKLTPQSAHENSSENNHSCLVSA